MSTMMIISALLLCCCGGAVAACAGNIVCSLMPQSSESNKEMCNGVFMSSGSLASMIGCIILLMSLMRMGSNRLIVQKI